MYDEKLQMSKLRETVFPIENRELKKFIPFALLIFITVFNFTQLRNIKDALVLTVPESGAEALSYLKSIVVMPSVILFSSLYVQLRKAVGFERAYEIIIAGFIIFFAIFNFVLLKHSDMLHMTTESISAWKAAYPRIQFIFPVIGAWTYTLYYLVAEMWGTFTLSVLFWQFANENIGTHEAKRFYPQFLFVNAIATMLVGLSMKAVFAEQEVESIRNINIIVIFSALVMLAIFRYVNTSVLTDPQFRKDVVDTSKKKKKPKLTFLESVKELMSSPYIGLLSIIILSYGLSINMIEACWKSAARAYYPTKGEYLAMMSDYSFYTGLTGIVLVLISRLLLRYCGWLTTAMVTPVIITIAGAGYFASTLFPETFTPVIAFAGFVDPLAFSVFFGMYGVILSKSSKYSFFDPTKELAYIPLDPDLRATGKAAADGVGGRLGKASSGWIQMILYGITGGSLINIMPYLATILLVLSLAWIVSVLRLNVMYHEALDEVGIKE